MYAFFLIIFSTYEPFICRDILQQGVWTEEEDALLAHWQSQYGNRWSDVSKHIPNKTGQQCAQRWRHRVNPAIRRTKWTQEEDELLFKLYQEHGNSWAVIARYLPGRTDQQCLGRWRRHLDPSVRRESWTISEDKKLLLLAEEFDCSWSQISKSMRNRTPQQCRTRWFHLTNHSESKASDLFAKERSNVDEYECDLEVQIVCRGKRSHRSKKRGRLRSSIAFLSEEENPNDVQDAQYKGNEGPWGIKNSIFHLPIDFYLLVLILRFDDEIVAETKKYYLFCRCQ